MQSTSTKETQVNSAKHDHENDALASDASFFDKPSNVKIILNVFYALCVILVALDFVVHRHIYLDFEEIPAFYAIYGFIACVVLVVLAKLMRLVLMRGEHYYDERLDEVQSVDSEAAPEANDASMDELGLSSLPASGDKK